MDSLSLLTVDQNSLSSHQLLRMAFLEIGAAKLQQDKIILHRIISVVDLTSFLPETWTRTSHDEES